MRNFKMAKTVMGLLLVVILTLSNIIVPIQNVYANDGVAVTRGAYFDLPETVENYLSSGKTLEFDLNVLIATTDVCKLRLYNGSTQVSSDFFLRDGEGGLSMIIEPIENGWYHYIISLATIPHTESHIGTSITRIRASTTYPENTKIKNISIGEDVRSLPEEFTDDYDTVTLADLGLSGKDYETTVQNGSYSYAGESQTHSVIVKFGWDANITETVDWKIALDTYWNNNCMVWFRPDAIYFCPGQGDFTELKVQADPVVSGKHDVEFGRLRVTAGPNYGKDYVFLKIDGEVVAKQYTNHYQTEGGYLAYNDVTTPLSYTVHFVNDGVKEQGFSGFLDNSQLEPDVYTEDYDTVTFADLGILGKDYETAVESGSYSYEGTSKTHSVVVKFGWEANITEEIHWKIALDTYWNNNCMVWFKHNKIYFCPGQGDFTELKVEADPVVSGKHDVEFGRLRVVDGYNKGKDYVFLKIDDEVVAEKYTTLYQTSGGYLAYNDVTTVPSYTVHFIDLVDEQRFSGLLDSSLLEPDVYTEDYDTVTFADLGISGTDYKTAVGSGSYKYDGKSKTHSVIVKFGWQAKITNTIDWKIALDTYWNNNCMVWFRDNKIYFCPGQGDFTELKVEADPVVSGKHDVEFGRLRVTDGYNKGKDYVFLKIDGKVVAEKYTYHYQTPDGYLAYNDVTTVPSYTVHFVNDGVKEQRFSGLLDTSKLEPDVYTKDYDTVTFADLGISGTDYKTAVQSGSYKYDGKSKTHSVIVKFGWQAKITSTIDWKIALDTYWNSNCMVWFRDNKIYFCPGQGDFTELKVEADPVVSGKHQVEFGRLRVTGGHNKGKDYVFLKIDGKVVAEKYTKHYQTSGGYLAYNDVKTVPSYTVHFINDGVKEQRFSGLLDTSKLDADVYTKDYDTVTLADLGISGKDYKTEVQSGSYKYDGKSKTHSVIVKFGWQAKITSTIDWKIALDTYWNSNCMVWFRDNKIYFCPGQDDFTELKVEADPVVSGKHQVEFGRLRVTDGYNKGKDYVFLKIDGKVVAEKYTKHYQTSGGYLAYNDVTTVPSYSVHFVNDGVKEQRFSGLLDTSKLEPDVYTKDYDTVTFADLGIAGTDYKTAVQSGSYKYDGKSKTHSVIVKFGWQAKITNTIDWKIALDTYWNNNCMVWFRDNKIYFCPGQGDFTELKVEADPVVSGKHQVEFGRLRVTGGHNKGKDYVFLKIDGKVVAEKYTKLYQTSGGYLAYNDITTVKSYSVHLVNDGVKEQRFSGLLDTSKLEPDVFTKDYDTVTLADLGISGKDYKTEVQSGSYKYDGKSKTHSVIVKFGWQAKITNTIDWKIALDTYWNSNCMVWFRDNKIYFCPGQGDFTELKVEADPVVSGKHQVEFGRLRVTGGHNKGKDYVFLKIDGKVVAEKYTKHYQTSGGYLAYNDVKTVPSYTVHFINDGVKEQRFSGLLDISQYGPTVLTKNYDTVTLADLEIIGKDYKTAVQSGSYKYDGKSKTHSVIVKFGWQAKITSTIDWKIALDTYWNSNCMVWFRDNKIYFCPGQGDFTELKVEADPVVSGKHQVEFGRLRVTGGYYKGKDYVFLKIDGKVVAEKYTNHYQTSGGYLAYNDVTTVPSYTVHFINDGVKEQRFSGLLDISKYGSTVLTKDYDTVTLADLRITGTDYKTAVQSGSYEYEGKSKTHSVVVKFGWDAKITSTIDWKIALDTYWNNNCMVWFRDNKIYFCPGQGDFTELKVEADPIIKGKHQVEFGRLRVTGGYYKGKDYVFLKIDGKVVAEKYTDLYQNPNGYLAYNDVTTVKSYTVHFVNDGVRYQGFSGFAEPDVYVTDIDYINIGDIVPGGVVKDTIHDGHLGYTYPVKTSSKTNSTVVKYVIKVGELAEGLMDGSVMVVDIGGNCGFCRAYISAGKKSSIMFGWEIEGCKVGTKSYTFESNNWYAVEQGRIRVTSGINAGKDYVYLKIDDQIVSSFYANPESRPMLGKQIYVEATENIKVLGSKELRVKYYVDNKLYLNQNAQKGFNVKQPTNPEKTNQYFVGWYTKKTGGNLFNFKNTKLTKNINLYARFTTKTVKVTFKSKDETITKVVGKNCLIEEPTKPASYFKNGLEYVFVGWENKKTGKIFNFETGRLNADTVLTAKYKEREYYVSYYANGKLIKKVPFVLSKPTVKGKEPKVPKITNTKGKWEKYNANKLTKSITVNAVYTVKVPFGSNAVKLTKHDRIYLNTDTIHDYLSTDTTKQSAFVREYNSSAQKSYQDYQNATFKWSDSGKNSSYTVYFADNKKFKNAYIVTTSETSLENEVGIFIPGKTYYWFVCGNDTKKCSKVDNFSVVDTPVRYITAGNVINMRDLGGQESLEGGKVRYEKIYRGAALDEYTSHIDDAARYVFNYLGIQSEVELRGGVEHEFSGWDENNPNVYYAQGANYEEILEIGADQKAQYVAMFDALADEKNYPVYFHCSAGADRTGTLAFLLYGLLGVKYEDIRSDYELTSFSAIGLRAADFYHENLSMDGLYNGILEQYGDGSGNLKIAVEKFLKDYIGVSSSTLKGIESILLDKDAEPNEEPNIITVDVLGEKYTYKAFSGIYFMPDTPRVIGKLFVGFYNGNTKYNGYTNKDIELVAKFEDIKYAPYDTITLKDLGFEEEKVLNKTNTVCTYEKTAESGGRLFQFVLEPIGNMNNGDGPQIALTNDWSKNSFARVWFQTNTMSQIYYSGVLDAGPDITKMLSLEAGKQYDIEFAVRVMQNKGYEGKKVLEITVDGELLVQHIGCEADLSENLIYLHGGTGSAYLINKPVYKTVNFYDGDKLIGSYKAERCALLPKVEEPASRNGLRFAGWYTEKTGGRLWDENVDLVYNDINLYAHFGNVRKITANIDGKIFIYRVEVGKTLDELPKPRKQGNVFMGWAVGEEIFTGKVVNDMSVTALFEEYSFDDYDEISLRDLGISGDLNISKLGPNNTANYTYHKAAKTGGRVFKAIYVPTENMSNGPQVSFSPKWDENYFAKLYFTKADTIYVYSSGIDGGLPTLTLDYELVGGKEYNFEIGVRVLNNKGYKGVKVLMVYINDELIFEEFDNRANIDGADVFIQGMPDTGVFRNIDIYKTVSFYDGDKLLSSVKVLRGERVKSYGKLADKGDMLFVDWLTEFGQEWDFDVDCVYLDTTFKAKFQKLTYPVLLMVDGVLYKRINVFAGEKLEIFDVPVKEGYEFDKWLLEDGSEYDMEAPVNAPITLVASFNELEKVDTSLPEDNAKPNDDNETKPSNIKYILFSIIGLAAIVTEAIIIIFKKRLKK